MARAPLPQVRSASPGNDLWNGVYRGWEIYVTDSASSDPAQWGAPAAEASRPSAPRRSK